MVIVANGVKSQFVTKITGKPNPLVKTGRSAYRALVPFDKVRERPELFRHWKGQENGFLVPMNLAGGMVFLVTYPCRDASVLNIAVMHPTRAGQEDAEDWHSTGSVDDLLAVTPGFHPDVHELLKLAPEVKVFTLHKKEPLDRLTRGKGVVIGDAAHIMQPTHAQGGTISLEEAAALEILFKGVEPAEVEQRLELYNDIMLDHVQIVQLLSDAPFYAESPLRDRAAKLSKRPLFPVRSHQFSQPVQDFFYGYDAFEEARGGLKAAAAENTE